MTAINKSIQKHIPPIRRARSTYKNGILEITFDKKQKTKLEGKEINIE